MSRFDSAGLLPENEGERCARCHGSIDPLTASIVVAGDRALMVCPGCEDDTVSDDAETRIFQSPLALVSPNTVVSTPTQMHRLSQMTAPVRAIPARQTGARPPSNCNRPVSSFSKVSIWSDDPRDEEPVKAAAPPVPAPPILPKNRVSLANAALPRPRKGTTPRIERRPRRARTRAASPVEARRSPAGSRDPATMPAATAPPARAPSPPVSASRPLDGERPAAAPFRAPTPALSTVPSHPRLKVVTVPVAIAPRLGPVAAAAAKPAHAGRSWPLRAAIGVLILGVAFGSSWVGLAESTPADISVSEPTVEVAVASAAAATTGTASAMVVEELDEDAARSLEHADSLEGESIEVWDALPITAEFEPPDLKSDGWLEGWTHPISGPERHLPLRSSRFFGAERSGQRPRECRRGHCGVDLANRRGLPVVAARGGVIKKVMRRNRGISGRYVIIDHGQFATAYMHLDKVRRSLEPGTEVVAGELLGTTGRTGIKHSEPHLHFAVTAIRSSKRRRFIDPLRMLERARIVDIEWKQDG